MVQTLEEEFPVVQGACLPVMAPIFGPLWGNVRSLLEEKHP